MKNYSVSAIIPVGRGESRAALCLEHFSRLSPPPEEIVLVCDGANKVAQEAAESFGARHVELPRRLGPAHARNQGAFAARGDILLFVDADVLVPTDVVAKINAALDRENGVAACFGSYDDAPAATNFLSQYKNLFHHYVHQNSPTEASTFWTGCGAIFKDLFEKLGGFNENFDLPSVEDIEFGYRLRDAGYRVRLIHGLQVKHLKRWNALLLLRTDLFRRAIPWTRLLLTRPSIPQELKLRVNSRASGLLAVVLLGALVCLPFYWPIGLGIASLAALGLLSLNLPLYRFFRQKKGLLFTAGAIAWSWFYYFYSSLGFGTALVLHGLARLKPGVKRARKSERIGAELPLE